MSNDFNDLQRHFSPQDVVVGLKKSTRCSVKVDGTGIRAIITMKSPRLNFLERKIEHGQINRMDD